MDLMEFYGNKEHEFLNEFESSEQGFPINDECGAITKNDYDNYYEGPVRLVMGGEREDLVRVNIKMLSFMEIIKIMKTITLRDLN